MSQISFFVSPGIPITKNPLHNILHFLHSFTTENNFFNNMGFFIISERTRCDPDSIARLSEKHPLSLISLINLSSRLEIMIPLLAPHVIFISLRPLNIAVALS